MGPICPRRRPAATRLQQCRLAGKRTARRRSAAPFAAVMLVLGLQAAAIPAARSFETSWAGNSLRYSGFGPTEPGNSVTFDWMFAYGF